MIGFNALRKAFTIGVPAIALAYAVITTLGLVGVTSPNATQQIIILVASFAVVALAELVFFRELL
jgi:hypothetical protein